jgi:hypothetical protein
MLYYPAVVPPFLLCEELTALIALSVVQTWERHAMVPRDAMDSHPHLVPELQALLPCDAGPHDTTKHFFSGPTPLFSLHGHLN